MLGNIKMSLVTMLFPAARDQMVPRYPGTLTVSVNNKNVEIDPVFCRPRPPPIFLVDMYILTSYNTSQVSHEYLHALTKNKHTH